MAAYHVTPRNRYRQPPLVPDEIAIQSLVLGRNPFILRRDGRRFFLFFLSRSGLITALLPLLLRFPACLGFGFLTGSLGSLACLLHLVGYHLVYFLVQSGKLLLLLFHLFFQVFLLLPQASYVLLLFVMLLLQQSLLLLTFGNQTVFLRFHPQ